MALVLVKTAGGILAANYIAHVGSAWAFHEFCVPKTVWDIAQSLVTTASPVCSVLVSVLQSTQTNYASVLTTSIVTTVTGILKVV